MHRKDKVNLAKKDKGKENTPLVSKYMQTSQNQMFFRIENGIVRGKQNEKYNWVTNTIYTLVGVPLPVLQKGTPSSLIKDEPRFLPALSSISLHRYPYVPSTLPPWGVRVITEGDRIQVNKGVGPIFFENLWGKVRGTSSPSVMGSGSKEDKEKVKGTDKATELRLLLPSLSYQKSRYRGKKMGITTSYLGSPVFSLPFASESKAKVYLGFPLPYTEGKVLYQEQRSPKKMNAFTRRVTRCALPELLDEAKTPSLSNINYTFSYLPSPVLSYLRFPMPFGQVITSCFTPFFTPYPYAPKGARVLSFASPVILGDGIGGDRRRRKGTGKQKGKVFEENAGKVEGKEPLEWKEKLALQETFIENESIPCVPLEHQKTLQCTNCLVSVGALVSAGQEICEQNNKIKSSSPFYSLHTPETQILATAESGQVIKIDTNKITLRRAHCYLVYSQAFLSVVNTEYIKKGTALLSLKYEKLLTGDIVQGLGKIEELLESPKLSLNLSFKICLRRYLTKVSLDKAIQWSYGELQERLVQSVQQVYVDQGCFISDKHLEIIVRQATSLAIILFPGDTGFLHHEVVLIDRIEKINKQVVYENNSAGAFLPLVSGSFTPMPSFSSKTSRTSHVPPFLPPSLPPSGVQVITEGDRVITEDDRVQVNKGVKPSESKVKTLLSKIEDKRGNKSDGHRDKMQIQGQKAIYYPHLKGITWSSLNSDSILSAASFQETRRVLRDNLVTDKVDFLKGIKERIILGELLEMGTGFFKNHF